MLNVINYAKEHGNEQLKNISIISEQNKLYMDRGNFVLVLHYHLFCENL